MIVISVYFIVAVVRRDVEAANKMMAPSHVICWGLPGKHFGPRSWPLGGDSFGNMGVVRGVGRGARTSTLENKFEIDHESPQHRNKSLKLAAKIRDFWENDPPFKILVTPLGIGRHFQ
jgi:hypothetical protein